MSRSWLTFAALSQFILLYFNQNDAVLFKMTNAVCESYNKSWVEIEHCRLRAIARNKTVLNINATFLYPVNNIHVRVQVLKKANGYRPWLVDIKVDACQFTKNPNNPTVKMIWALFKDVSNVNHSCPYEGRQIVKDFYLRSEKLLVVLPTGDYACFLTWFFYNKPAFVTNVYFTFDEDFRVYKPRDIG